MNYKCIDCGKWFYNCNDLTPYIACSNCGGDIWGEEEVKQMIEEINKKIAHYEYMISKLKDEKEKFE